MVTIVTIATIGTIGTIPTIAPYHYIPSPLLFPTFISATPMTIQISSRTRVSRPV